MSPEFSIAHYRITSKLGEGGMGAVYRATDTKLNRDVAIKVIPEEFARDPDRMARFTREAQVLASLNHPNIAAIYGVEERALVMELVEGTTVADRIAAGPIPLDEALALARQIADALAYWTAGKAHYDPGKITVPTFLIHAEWDFDLPSYQAQAYFAELKNAPYKRLVEIGEGTHTVIMEKNRMQLFTAVQQFLDEKSYRPGYGHFKRKRASA